MSDQNPTQSVVQRGQLRRKSVPEALSLLDTVCSAAAQCPEVQGDPVALHTLAVLQQALAKTHGSLAERQKLAQALTAAIKTLALDFGELKGAFVSFETAIDVLAKGNAALINRAGLRSRDAKTPPAALETVTEVHCAPGKRPREAIITWPAARGATSYAIEINATPALPEGPWTALVSGTARRRVVVAPAPGAPVLVRVAALGAFGEQAEWSSPALATAR